MFHGVCRQVNLQAGGVRVTTVTVMTLEGLVLVVLPTVRLQVGQLSESLFTAGMVTLVGSVTSVNSEEREKQISRFQFNTLIIFCTEVKNEEQVP